MSLARIESKIEELLILKDSPEKDRKAEMDKAFIVERKQGEFTREARGYEEFLMLQNLDTERRMKI